MEEESIIAQGAHRVNHDFPRNSGTRFAGPQRNSDNTQMPSPPVSLPQAGKRSFGSRTADCCLQYNDSVG